MSTIGIIVLLCIYVITLVSMPIIFNECLNTKIK